MKLFRASQRSVVHIEAVLTSNQSLVWPAKIFQRFIDTVVCKRCLSQSFGHQSTSCAKHHMKSSSLLGYFDCFPSNHIVGCCNINFSDLSQIRRENFALQAMSLLFCCTFLHDCSCFVATFGQLFTLRPPNFCFSPTRYAHSLLKNEFCSNIHGWLLREEQRKRTFKANEVSKRRSKKLFFTLFCALNQNVCSSR